MEPRSLHDQLRGRVPAQVGTQLSCPTPVRLPSLPPRLSPHHESLELTQKVNPDEEEDPRGDCGGKAQTEMPSAG